MNNSRDLMLIKLKESGLVKFADKLSFKPLTTEQCASQYPQLTRYPSTGFVIPYFDIHGKPMKFFRYRYTELPKLSGFDALIRKAIRYVQPANADPRVYFSPMGDWKKIVLETAVPLYVTEGELKAACAVSMGIPTLGLGGVWNYQSKSDAFIPDLEQINWADRAVYIVYDSDAVTNGNVMLAESRFATQLLKRGALVHIVRLPYEVDRKVGLDDFLVEHGKDAFGELVNEAEKFNVALHAMNEEVRYIKDPSAIIKLEDKGQVMSCSTFVNEAFYDRTYTEIKINADGESRKVEKRTAKEWMGWSHRAVVERLAYEPGQPAITGKNELNRWTGWGVEPKEGDVRPWTMLLDFLLQGNDPTHRLWFEQWFAYPLQYPGTKLETAVVMWSLKQGNGKSLVGNTVGKLYGQNFVEIGNKQLESAYNAAWAKNKQLVMGDEIACEDNNRRAIYTKMKAWITQLEVFVTEKYVPDYKIRDCLNYYFNSNSPDAFYLVDEDRRFAIFEAQGAVMKPKFYKDFIEWRDTKGGAEALMYHLLHLDLTGFDPKGRAPETRAKREMIAGGRSYVESWVESVTQAPLEMLNMSARNFDPKTRTAFKLYTISELVGFAKSHQTDEKGFVSDKTLGKALAKFKFKKVQSSEDGRLHLPQGFQAVWVMRDGDRLLKVVDPTKLRDEYLKERK